MSSRDLAHAGRPTSSRPQLLVVGGGFAGLYAARTLERLLSPGAADITLISETDHLCYSPLLPEVAAGTLEPRRVAVPLHAALRRTRILQGEVGDIDLDRRCVRVECGLSQCLTLTWDRLAVTTGSITRPAPSSDLAPHVLGIKTIAEAAYIHDHILRQLEMADATTDLAERRARLTFLVVGSGYAGTETAAQLQHSVDRELTRFPRLTSSDVTWMLLDLAEHILPELGDRLGRAALATLRRRGVQVRLGTTVTRATEDQAVLSDGTSVPTHTLVWTVGVTPPPIVAELGVELVRGRAVVDQDLQLTEHVWAAGDTAAAKNPYGSGGTPYPPTAQHAQRQGVVIGHNMAASLDGEQPRPYRHHDLGLVADLGGAAAVARPLGVSLTGPVAKAVTKGYHLYAIPSLDNRLRILSDWTLNTLSRPISSQLGLVRHPFRRRAAEAVSKTR